MSITDVHRDETIAYVLRCVRDLRKAEQARVDIYVRQPHAIALEAIARDHCFRLGQLVRAIEAGLYDQLDAADAELAIVTAAVAATDSGRSVESFVDVLPSAIEYVDYAEAAAVREIEREMAIEAGDDSELDRQIAEDDARADRAAWLAACDTESEVDRA